MEDDAGEDGPGDDEEEVVGDGEVGVFDDEEGEEDGGKTSGAEPADVEDGPWVEV